MEIAPFSHGAAAAETKQEKSLSIVATVRGDGGLVAVAIHDGHQVRPEVGKLLALDEATRLREEDPFTGLLTHVAPTRIIGLRSRFEVDLNRPREKAVYVTPEDAWGLDVWRSPPTQDLIDRSLAEYDAFYEHMANLLASLFTRQGAVLVLDLHSYNHRREGPNCIPAELDGNPVVNVGTGSVDRRRWGGLVDQFIAGMRSAKIAGRPLDVRENIKFMGGNFSTWINTTFSGNGVALAIEFKKVFMDEWTGLCDYSVLSELELALDAGADAAMRKLQAA